MKNSMLLFVLLLLQTVSGQPLINTNDPNTFTIHSKVLNEDRTCLISVPETYCDGTVPARNYPLILLLDGATFFKTASGVVHFMSSDRNRNHLMPESIIVAIENVDRRRDFTVTRIETKRPNTSGGGQKFLDFIQQELIPYIDENYRTTLHRTLVGHSLGGLLTLNAYRDKNSLFDSYLSVDPSIWWEGELMQAKVDSIAPVCFNRRLYIATANQGAANYERNKKRHDALYSLLKKKAGNQLQVKVDYFEHEDHRSVPLKAFYEGLKYLNQ